jgi:hypothetical protein
LLEEAEQRRLLERWLHTGLEGTEAGALPAALRKQAKAYFDKLLDDARRDVEEGRVGSGPAVMKRLARRLRARR